MTTTTTLVAAEDALLALLVAASHDPANALYRVVMQLGDPGPAQKPEQIWIGEHARVEQRYDLTGAGSQERYETFELEVYVYTELSARSYTALRNRHHTVLAAVEQIVRNNWFLSSTVWLAETKSIDRTGGFTQRGRALGSVLRVGVESYF